MNQWANFFSAMAESAATLTGLIFVAASINLAKILSIPVLIDRSLESIILLLNIILVSALALIPGISAHAEGAKFLMNGVVAWACMIYLDRRIWRNSEKEHKRHAIQNTIFSQLAVLPYIIGGIIVIYQGYDGIYWVIPGIFVSFIKAVIDAWVILVEIHR